jgi:hypothetical protein
MSRSSEAGRPMVHARTLAVLLWLLAAVGAVAMVMGTIVAVQPAEGRSWTPVAVFALIAVDALTCTTVGTLIVTRRPDNWVGWLLAVIGVGLVWTFAGFGIGVYLTERAGRNDLLAGLFGWIGLVLLNPMLALLGLMAVLFPDGRLPSARWRIPVGAVFVTILAATAIIALMPGSPDPTLADNPFGVEHPVVRAVVPWALTAVSLGGLVSILLGVVAVGCRFVRARGDTRQQLKWFMAAVALVAVTAVIPTIVLSAGPDGGSNELGLLDLAGAVSLALVPIAIGVAVLRYRLYDIDRLISRTVGWAVVTVILLAVFGTGLVAVQAALAGITQGETLAVAASTLVALALFQPVRRRVQGAVDRRFDRARYDAARVVEGFSERLRDPLDLATLADEIARVATETVRPASAAVWLRHGRGPRGDVS